jgi:hypothetical protein
VAKIAVKSSMLKSRVEVPMSCRALIVPGILPSLSFKFSNTKPCFRYTRSIRRGRDSCQMLSALSSQNRWPKI